MQTAALPLSLYDRIDRKIRDFIWGSSNGMRKVHNVNWETVCKPKNMGGLGLRSARELNKAFLMKVAWGILTKPEELWVRTIFSKYLIRNNWGFTLKRKTGFSSLWRGVLKVWDHTLQGLRWSVNNGRATKFWTDKWLDSGITLKDFSNMNQEVDLALSVSHFVLPNGDWDSNRLAACLQNVALMQVMGMTPPDDQLGDDAIVWGLEASGRFSVKTAYWLVKELTEEENDTVWRKVWAWEGPAKVKHFIWLVMHGKLMTNEERRQRHLSPDAICPDCQAPCESLDHVLRKCHVAQAVWKEVLPLEFSTFSDDVAFVDWWKAGIANTSHSLLFGVTSWLLWLRRNRLVFQNERLSVFEICRQVKFWTHLYSSSWKALQLSREAPGLARQAQLIGWRPAEEGWFSLNSDGSLVHNPNSAAAGGIIRDSDGRFVVAYAANLGVCSIMRAEIRGIVEGMKLAWNKGIRKLRIQSDSKAAVEMLVNRRNPVGQHSNLVEQFFELSSRPWEVSIHHIYREANYAANYLANFGRGGSRMDQDTGPFHMYWAQSKKSLGQSTYTYKNIHSFVALDPRVGWAVARGTPPPDPPLNFGHSFGFVVHVLDAPDSSLLYWLNFDAVGSCTTRLIPNNIM
ncbi:Putative ribonuclease H protein At1g65750 [Linum perenne]